MERFALRKIVSSVCDDYIDTLLTGIEENEDDFPYTIACYNFIDEWKDITKNIKADIVVIDMPLLDTTKNKDLLGTFISDLILQILSYVAEQERTFIKQRQKECISTAKNKGIKFGRPTIEKPQNFDIVVNRWKNKEIKTKEAIEQLGLKPSTFYNIVNKY